MKGYILLIWNSVLKLVISQVYGGKFFSSSLKLGRQEKNHFAN